MDYFKTLVEEQGMIEKSIIIKTDQGTTQTVTHTPLNMNYSDGIWMKLRGERR